MSEIELFLDDTPGETRGALFRDGRPHRLIIHREDDAPASRLGARSVGRVVELSRPLGLARLDLGGGATASLPAPRDLALHDGQHLEVEVAAEARDGKAPTLRLIGPADGPARWLSPGPDVSARLKALAPGVEVLTGAEAIRAIMEAEEEALAVEAVFPEHGLSLAVQRTRALIAVDVDHKPSPGRDGHKARAAANQRAMIEAARLIGLKRWGGLTVIDLAGGKMDPAVVTAQAREAFAAWPEAAFGPLSRFGLFQLSLPWRDTPVDEVLFGSAERRTQTRAISLTRRLRLALLSDTTTARITAFARPDLAECAGSLIARLGPRAALTADPAVAPEGEILEQR